MLAAKVVRGASEALHTWQREQVADAVVKTMRELPDDPWKLNEPLPKDWGIMSDLGSPAPDDWCKPK